MSDFPKTKGSADVRGLVLGTSSTCICCGGSNWHDGNLPPKCLDQNSTQGAKVATSFLVLCICGKQLLRRLRHSFLIESDVVGSSERPLIKGCSLRALNGGGLRNWVRRIRCLHRPMIEVGAKDIFHREVVSAVGENPVELDDFVFRYSDPSQLAKQVPPSVVCI